MIDLKSIYEATNGGKDIILKYVPQATETKNFSYRPDDKNPSARLYAPNENRDYWIIKDYGANGEKSTLSPIDIYMPAMRLKQADFGLAVKLLAEEFGVSEQLDNRINRPRIEKRPATADEIEGKKLINFSTSVCKPAHLQLWGPNVKPEHLQELGWSSADSIVSVKDGMATVRYSTDTYPIFVQSNCYIDAQGNEHEFYKVYQPLNPDKSFRFYIIGMKKQNYIFGLDAAKRKFNLNGQQPLERICLVSGGSDAVNCLSMGFQPVWLGSETQALTPAMYAELKKIAKVVYVCYDADLTGIAAARRLALQYLDIRVIWLPQKVLGLVHDQRGKAFKDLKDYLALYPSQSQFDVLVKKARPAMFWEKNGPKITTSLNRLCYFLELNGYKVLKGKLDQELRLIHVNGIIVEEVSITDVQHFIKGWMKEYPLDDEVIDKVMRSRDVNSLLPSNMTQVELDFSSATPTSQMFYFRNCCVEVTKEAITRHEYSQMEMAERYVWQHKIIQHDYVPHDPMFTIERRDDGTYSIQIHSTDSEAFCFLINASRNHWRKEMETRFGDDLEAKAAYASSHMFCIDGDGLTPEEIAEQMQSLANKQSAIGYLLHRYKIKSRAWGVFCFDNKIGEGDECNGRTGKSLFGHLLCNFLENVTIDAKNRDITERPFLYAKVNSDTGLVFVDECHKNLDFSHFYARITGDFQVEKKGVDPISIPFAQSPKIMIATNYINPKRDASAQARELPVVFSDYYHQRADNNDYLEDRSVADDFGHDLFNDDYQGWESDIAFLMQCEQFYLSVVETGDKIMPPLSNIKKRQLKVSMGSSFEHWAESYYEPGGGHLDVMESLDVVYNLYKAEVGIHADKISTFDKKLKTYCECAAHISVYNPKDITGNKTDGERWRKHETQGYVRYVYIRSTAEASRMAVEASQKHDSDMTLPGFDPFAAANELNEYDGDDDLPF